MKKRYLFLSTILLTGLAIVLQSSMDGPASNNNRATGAPGDGPNLCTSCHFGGAFGQVSIGLTMLDSLGDTVTNYVPLDTYSLQVNVSAADGTPAGYGFQMISIKLDDGSPLSQFLNPGSGVQISTSAGRQYAEHDAPSPTGVFSIDWVAPATGTGNVTMFLGANAVNGNSENTEDNADLAEFTFTEVEEEEEWPEGIASATAQSGLSVYPNPAINELNVVSNSEKQSALEVYSLHGQLVMSTAKFTSSLDVSALESGVYLLKSGDHTTRFLKL